MGGGVKLMGTARLDTTVGSIDIILRHVLASGGLRGPQQFSC